MDEPQILLSGVVFGESPRWARRAPLVRRLGGG